MWEKLDLVRIYTKPKGKQPDYSAPVVLRHNRCTVEDFCNNIHKDISYVQCSLSSLGNIKIDSCVLENN